MMCGTNWCCRNGRFVYFQHLLKADAGYYLIRNYSLALYIVSICPLDTFIIIWRILNLQQKIKIYLYMSGEAMTVSEG